MFKFGVTQAAQGSGFTGLRFAAVPENGTEPLQSLTQNPIKHGLV